MRLQRAIGFLYLQHVVNGISQPATVANEMASLSQGAEDEQRKLPLDTKRDQRQPRMSSRRFPLSQQAPVFETESLLNISNVQTPSPTKPYARPNSRIHSRQAFNSGRSLATTYAATPRKTDENKPPFSIASSPRGVRRTPLKPRPTQPLHSTSESAGKAQSSDTDTRLKTPSPARGRRNSIVSPVSSASSPPRGLAESYQRIVDEENLAHEESIEEMAEFAESFSPSEVVQHDDRKGGRPTRRDESPTSLKASRREAPPISQDQRKPTHSSFRDIYESLGDVENDTASTMPDIARNESPTRGDSQLAKDLRRMNGAVKSEPQIFRKALVGNRAGLTVENLRRNNEGSDSLSSSLGGSISSRTSDPSINVPKQWGRKARPGKDWLSRINSKSGRLTGDVPKKRILHDMGPAPTDQGESENRLAAAAAEVRLPSGDDISSQAASSRSSTPTTSALRSKSHDRVLAWELQDEDFTGRSLQVSDSPPIRIRNATLDKVLEEEISIVAKKAVTTSRLGELRDKSSHEQIRQRSLSRSTERNQVENRSTLSGEERRHEREDLGQQPKTIKMETPSKSAEGLGPGVPIPDTPVVVYKSDSSSSRANEDSLDSEELQCSTSQRPKHRRHDSHDLLRKLARATSASPSPSMQDIEVSTEHRRSDRDTEANDKIEQLPESSKKDGHTTPQPSRPNAYLKTPMVTGAWIDTPLPIGGRGPPMPTPDLDSTEHKSLQRDSQKIASGELIRKLSPHTTPPKMPDEELKQTAPRLPKSALESIINAAKSKSQSGERPLSSSQSEEDATLLLGDSTIHSLEELMVNDTDVSALLEPSPIAFEANRASATHDKPLPSRPSSEDDDNSPPASLNRPDRPHPTDLQAYTRQLSRLSNLVPSLRETKKGLASLERAVSAPTTPSVAKDLMQQPKFPRHHLTTKDTECTEAGEFHDFIWPCERCGCPAALSRTGERTYDYDFDLARISIPIPRLWRWRHDSWRPRLTWSGIVVFTLWLLWLGEMWARDRYCRKRFAHTMVGYGVDVNAPEPPFVLAKVLWRRLGASFLVDVVRFFAGVVGWVVGFGGGTERGGGRGREPVSRDERIPKPEWGPDFSMMDDEYL
ncbi:MAG: hypothetical protein LQ338_001791 [Usnochroma carphineum]|nr:MAG: hypothetical protein LQ338_001791 [Usnochroma carphineum]